MWSPTISSDEIYHSCICHSAKGTKWKNHKYIAIKNGRYIYTAVKKSANKLKKNVKDFIDYDITGEGYLENARKGTVGKNGKLADGYLGDHAQKEVYKRYAKRGSGEAWDKYQKSKQAYSENSGRQYDAYKEAVIPKAKKKARAASDFVEYDIPNKVKKMQENRKKKKAAKIKKLLEEYG